MIEDNTTPEDRRIIAMMGLIQAIFRPISLPEQAGAMYRYLVLGDPISPPYIEKELSDKVKQWSAVDPITSAVQVNYALRMRMRVVGVILFGTLAILFETGKLVKSVADTMFKEAPVDLTKVQDPLVRIVYEAQLILAAMGK